MQLVLKREPSTDKSTPGKLYIDGAFECFTLEDVVREQRNSDGTLVPVSTWKIDRETAIPSGTYRVVLDLSRRFERIMPHILNVPGFCGIRIHSGNTAADTIGCILVGRKRQTDDVLESKLAFDPFYKKIQAAVIARDTIQIDVINPEPAADFVPPVSDIQVV